MGAKDFGIIENDYAFFMAHATEAANDAAAYRREIAGWGAQRASLRLLDFGCGTGEFTQRVMDQLRWNPEVLKISLVEPVAHQGQRAAERLASFSRHPIHPLTQLPAGTGQFDLILANHVLYYVNDLSGTLQQLWELLAPGGRLFIAMAGWDNPLMQLWQKGFALIGRPVPYYAADDVASILTERNERWQTSTVPYQLRFPDSRENRLKILRFLLADHLQEMPVEHLLGEFDAWTREGHVEVNTYSEHFDISGG